MPACHAGDRRFESGRVRHPSPFPRTPRPPARTGRSSSAPYNLRRERPRPRVRPAQAASAQRRPPRRVGYGAAATTADPRGSCRWMRASSVLVLVVVVRAGARASSAERPVGRSPVRRPSTRRSPPRSPGRVAPSASPPSTVRRRSAIPVRRSPPGPPPRRRGPCRADSPEPAPSSPRPTSRSSRSPTSAPPGPASRAADVAGLATGGSPFKALVLVEEDADAILVGPGPVARRAGQAPGHGRVRREARARTSPTNRGRVGVPAGRRGRALGAGARLGRQEPVRRRTASKSLAKWPLTARLPGPARLPAYDPATAWTMVAGGDILLDRGVSLAIRGSRRGADFPFDGGTVEITGRCKDCSPMGWDLPYTKRTGNAGVVRELDLGRRHRHRQLREPSPERIPVARQGHRVLGQPQVHQGTGRRRPGLGVAGQQPHR